MRTASNQRQSDRRAAILDAAQRCFSRDGFHQASMQQICAEAGMSPGNLYRYFPSKEAIIAGIVERNRADAARDFASVANAPDFFTGLRTLAYQYLIERPEDEVGLCAEIMAESRRNSEVADLHQGLERDVKVMLVDMLRRAADRGEFSGNVDLDAAATMLMVLADGMSWRRASDQDFDAEKLMPYVLHMVRCMLIHPVDQADGDRTTTEESHA